MSSTRNQYDNCAYGHKMKEIQGMFYWTLDPRRQKNCTTCSSTLGPRSTRIGTSEDLTQADFDIKADIESLLSNRNLPLNKCTDGMNLLENKTKALKAINLGSYPSECNDFLPSNDTRLVNPVMNLRAINIDRFENPIIDPKSWIAPNNVLIGMRSRNAIKDSFDKNRPFKKHNQ